MVKSKPPGFKFHPKCQPNGISHLAFSDDLMLFARGDTYSVAILMDCLHKLEECSGLTVSPTKSNIYLAGVPGLARDMILRGLWFWIGNISVLESYIHKWNDKNLSYARKVELIRSICQGVEAFWLYVFPMPKAILKTIGRMCVVFLWGGRQSRVPSKEIGCPKDEGGLGLMDLKI
ncbi:hypothetical protein LIER_21908 [Lithospermum erythrorhizon]|uniref:Reverse transcriptase domain-containing protein n=1 Tax=Lithospermum erythrorhizon TaxID=34254 RepID=A0AAV3QUW2_LITER